MRGTSTVLWPAVPGFRLRHLVFPVGLARWREQRCTKPRKRTDVWRIRVSHAIQLNLIQ